MIQVILLTSLFIVGLEFACLDVWNETETNETISTNMISYLYYRRSEDSYPDITGLIDLNYMEKRRNTTETTFTIFMLEDVDLSVGSDISDLFREVTENGFDGLILSSSKSKLTGEIMYFYSRDEMQYDLRSFEVREQVIIDINNTFPNGAFFSIKRTDNCDPYFNYWRDYYTGFVFHMVWILNAVVSIVVMLGCVYILAVKFFDLNVTFRVVVCLYSVSQLFRIWDAVFFIIAKYYRQGESVGVFEISDVLGSITSYSLSLSALVLYVSHLHLSLNVRIIDISEVSRIMAIIVSAVMFVLTVTGTSIMLLTRSSFLHRICVIYFLGLFILTVVYYFRLTYIFVTSVINNNLGDKFKKSMKKNMINILAQNVLLFLSVILTLPAVYVVSPTQTAFFPALVHIFFNLATLVQLYHLQHVKMKKKSKITHRDH